MREVYLAFYKAWNNKYAGFDDRVIGVWTNGPYSHVEIVLKNRLGYVMCSALGSKNKVRCTSHRINNSVYDYIKVNVRDINAISKFFAYIKNSKYDYRGILFSQVISLGIDNDKKWFCSEACVAALKVAGIDNKDIELVKSESVSPNDLAYMVNLIESDHKPIFIKNIPLLFKKELENIYEPFNIKKINKIVMD